MRLDSLGEARVGNERSLALIQPEVRCTRPRWGDVCPPLLPLSSKVPHGLLLGLEWTPEACALVLTL